ncbi:uncharacterized protein LOC134196434 isoform X2 [Corticium candelabrum]|uniref:uncharacterized protein LOC134196434 isoform X2 n=1 Tax=Corticium candelabrum TaxID=121492 RepID=UPI002E272338|nr:uncharacterized protein LOC134196434 isoform X2 [Corticium candelabrum]
MTAVDPKWQSHMRPRYSDLTTGLRVSGTVLDHLYQSGLLDSEGRSTVDKVQPNTEEEKVRCLLGLLEKKPPGSFENFCNVLEDDKVGYKHLALMLRSESGGGGDVQETGPCSGGMHEQAAAPEGTHSDDAELTPVELDKIAEKLGSHYHRIAIYLGFDGEEIKQYEEEYDKKSYRILFAILDKWQKREHTTRKVLLDACKEAGVGGAASRILYKS